MTRYRDAATPDYSHRYHAGNVGDVWKHCALVDILHRAGSADRGRVLDVARTLTAYDTGGFTNPTHPVDVSPGREHDRDIILMRMEKGVWKQETDWLTPRKF